MARRGRTCDVCWDEVPSELLVLCNQCTGSVCSPCVVKHLDVDRHALFQGSHECPTCRSLRPIGSIARACPFELDVVAPEAVARWISEVERLGGILAVLRGGIDDLDASRIDLVKFPDRRMSSAGPLAPDVWQVMRSRMKDGQALAVVFDEFSPRFAESEFWRSWSKRARTIVAATRGEFGVPREPGDMDTIVHERLRCIRAALFDDDDESLDGGREGFWDSIQIPANMYGDMWTFRDTRGWVDGVSTKTGPCALEVMSAIRWDMSEPVASARLRVAGTTRELTRREWGATICNGTGLFEPDNDPLSRFVFVIPDARRTQAPVYQSIHDADTLPRTANVRDMLERVQEAKDPGDGGSFAGIAIVQLNSCAVVEVLYAGPSIMERVVPVGLA